MPLFDFRKQPPGIVRLKQIQQLDQHLIGWVSTAIFPIAHRLDGNTALLCDIFLRPSSVQALFP